MLQILSASSLRPLLRGRHPALALEDVPALTRDELGLSGLMLPTDLLAGAGSAELERLRRQADRSRCPILALAEPDPLKVTDARWGSAAVDRAKRVLRAAERLGCSSAGIAVAAPEQAADAAVEALQEVMETADGVGVNLLLRPAPGLTQTPDRMTGFIKRVGGFRIGTMPDFLDAAATGDPGHYLKRLAPYASVVIASFEKIGPRTRRPKFDLAACVGVLGEVGYDASIAIEHRGEGDPVASVSAMRDALNTALADAAP